MSKVGALKELEKAFRHWYWETDHEMPDIGILVISLSRDGCDLQYLGMAPDQVVDWPTLFAGIIEAIQSGQFAVDDMAAVPFDRRT